MNPREDGQPANAADKMHGMEDLLSILASARVYDLEHTRRVGDPIHPSHWPGYVYTLHRRHETGLERRTSASALILQAEHSGTHMDALCHQAEAMRLHGEVEISPQVQTPAGFTRLGIDTVRPVLRRGVLLDIADQRGGPLPLGTQVEAEELERVAAGQATEVRAGDVVLVRTGNATRWASEADYLSGCGIARSGSGWMAERRVFAVGADLVAWDLPGQKDAELDVTLPGHLILLVRNGIHIIENLYLEELARDRAFEFLFVCLPLKFAGGTGSPVRPIAVVPERTSRS